ncbi:MAG: RNA polymerase sigma factor [Candidatus Eisenbacteria bacterium]
MDPVGPDATLLSPPPAPAAGPSSWQADAADASRAAGGDFRAFERLYRAHVNRIHGLARRMLCADEAGEATQDVFVRAWQKIGLYRGEAAFGTWLHRLAVNVLLGRRQALKLQRERHLEDDSALELLPARVTRTSDLGVDFEAALDRLPPGARQVFVLHDVEGYRHEEIAQFLGVTTGTTKAQLHRARMLLRGHLEA